ncbi:nodulation protein NodH [Yoonia sp. 2307UL14-13]|uniref:nodulation protein NodH n=1 Tax=Yoonia sp. 2307UL14-13 TaxID=3126506 RepID=UPI00309B1B4C
MPMFDYFVVFAEMRTGSNLLEANLNQFPDLQVHGEAFNPSFVGYPKNEDILGVTLAARTENPAALIDAIKAANPLSGFRFFHDHDPRALENCLPDRRCAKVILTRNPVDSYISWKIAQATGQWKLTNATHAKTEAVAFDTAEFEGYFQRMQDFQLHLSHALQQTGQTAFYLTYDDLADIEVINGLAAFLGSAERLNNLNRKLKKQNPAPARDKVSNPADMMAALSGFDRFDLDRTPNFEPRRGPMIPSYVAAPSTGLLYLPSRAGLDGQIGGWLAALDGKGREDLQKEFSQKTLRKWKETHRGYRSFAVLRHPVVKAHHAFCRHILFDGPQLFPKIRETLRKVHRLPIPKEPIKRRNLKGYDLDAHKTAFLSFAAFLRHNLSAQTAVRIDPSWASQLAVLQGIAQFGLPDLIAREERLQDDLDFVCAQLGRDDPPPFVPAEDVETALLGEIYDDRVEQAIHAAYVKDYFAFGFSAWR